MLKWNEHNIYKSNNRKYSLSKIPLVMKVDVVGAILEMYLSGILEENINDLLNPNILPEY